MAGRKRYQKTNKKNRKRKPAQEKKNGLPVQAEAAPAEEDGSPDYRANYCKDLLEHSARGGTLAEFAFSIKATLGDLNDWAEANIQFKRAMELAALGSEAFWWQLARNSLKYKFNTAVWKFVMENLFGLKSSCTSEKPEINAQQQEQYIMIFPEQEEKPEPENET